MAYDAYDIFAIGFADKVALQLMRHIWLTCCIINGLRKSLLVLHGREANSIIQWLSLSKSYMHTVSGYYQHPIYVASALPLSVHSFFLSLFSI